MIYVDKHLREPRFHIAKRTGMVWWKNWLIRVFAVALALVFWLISVRFGTSPTTTLLACTLGLMVCYAFGTTWFLAVYTESADLSSALAWCVFPFILPDFLKLSLAFLLSRRIKKHLRQYRTEERRAI